MSCSCPETNWMDGKGHDLGCELYQPPPDKYRLKARSLIEDFRQPSSSSRPDLSRLEDAITSVLAEAAREGMERAQKIAGGYADVERHGAGSIRSAHRLQCAEEIAEAIRKEAACEKP